MTMQQALQSFGEGLRTISVNSTEAQVYHYWRPLKELPCIVWQETGRSNDFHTDNTKGEKLIDVDVDVYTNTEFDALLDALEAFLEASEIPYSLNDVDFDNEARVIHYSYTAQVVAHREE